MTALFVENFVVRWAFFFDNNFASKLIIYSLFPSFAETDDTFFFLSVSTQDFFSKKNKKILSLRNNSIH